MTHSPASFPTNPFIPSLASIALETGRAEIVPQCIAIVGYAEQKSLSDAPSGHPSNSTKPDRVQPSSAKPSSAKQGTVHLVGAGSGDPELLTLKAYRVMQQADVVLYDSLVSEDILDMCNQRATKIFVGKRRNNHALPQQDINELLVTHAQAGKCVVRLKGGDPFIFGRGGEELQTVVSHGIYFESIPGITAASAAASSASIPLTHRDCAQSVKFITAYKKDGAANTAYQEMLDPTQTVVLYMGLHRLPELTQGLMEAGRAASTPFALISHASLPTQQVLIGTLGSIAELQQQANLPTPALLIMGDVVNLHQELSPYNLASIANKAAHAASNLANHQTAHPAASLAHPVTCLAQQPIVSSVVLNASMNDNTALVSV